MKKLLLLILMSVVLCGTAHAQDQLKASTGTTEDPLQIAAGAGGTGATNVAKGTLSFTTNALRVLNTLRVAYTLYAGTGKDSVILVQVSQDSTNWSTGVSSAVGQGDNTGEAITIIGRACTDSLNQTPTLIVDSGGLTASALGVTLSATPVPYRYMRLKVYPFTAIPQTNLSIQTIRFYPDGSVVTSNAPY